MQIIAALGLHDLARAEVDFNMRYHNLIEEIALFILYRNDTCRSPVQFNDGYRND